MSERAKVLIVDDDEIVRLSHQRSLMTCCNVEAAWNGDGALRAMEQKPFDVVLLDLKMPGMDGISVLRTIKQRWPEAEVVVVTGYPTVETAKEAVKLGAQGYLAKPVGPVDLIEATNRAVTQKRWALRHVD